MVHLHDHLIAPCQSLVDEIYRIDRDTFAFLGVPVGHQAQVTALELGRLRQQLHDRGYRAPLVHPGGAAYNSACWFARLGGAATILARYGNDTGGQIAQQQAGNCGVTVYPLIDPALPTGTTIVLVDEEGARSMITCLGAAQEFRSDELPAHLRSTSSTLLIEGYMLGVGNGSAPDLFERMADDGATIVLSVAAPWIAERYPEAFQRIFERSRLVFMNEQEGERISGERDPGVAADRLRGTNRTVIVTAGSRGAYLGLPEGLLHSAARSVDVLDTTGAGDSYLAAFLRGVQLGATADQAARGAAFVASEVVSVVGSGTGLDLAEEWRALTFE